MTIRLFAALLAVVTLAGCSSTSSNPSARAGGARVGLRVVEARGAAAFEAEDQQIFISKLDEALFKEGQRFTRGSQYTLTWEPVKVDRGSRALRSMVGMGAGRAEIVVRGRLTDAGGRVLATQEVEGSQTFGVYGGSFASAVEETAEELAEWAAGVSF